MSPPYVRYGTSVPQPTDGISAASAPLILSTDHGTDRLLRPITTVNLHLCTCCPPSRQSPLHSFHFPLLFYRPSILFSCLFWAVLARAWIPRSRRRTEPVQSPPPTRSHGSALHFGAPPPIHQLAACPDGTQHALQQQPPPPPPATTPGQTPLALPQQVQHSPRPR